MCRIAISVSVFVVLACFGGVLYVYAQTVPALPTCPNFDGNYTYYQQRIRFCGETGDDSAVREISSGTWVFNQMENPDGSLGCLFDAVRTNAVGQVSRYTGVFRGTNVTMQAVPKPATAAINEGGYLVPPLVIFGDIIKSNKKTKAPTEIRYSFNANEGEVYDLNPYPGEGTGMTWPHHCAFSGSGIIYKNTTP